MTVSTTMDMIIRPANRLGSTEEYYFSKKLREIAQLRAQGQDILNLGIGSPDLPPAPQVIDRLNEVSRQAQSHGYQSYIGRQELRQAMADWYLRYFGVQLDSSAGEILPLIGSKEGIMHISMAFLNPGDEVLVPNPGYPTYRSATELAGGVVRPYILEDENNWLPDLAALAKTDLSKVKIMWVNYPHMPTGTPADPAFFRELVDFALAHEILLVNDNPYAFILTEERHSLLAVAGAKQVVLELNSLSKAQNMAGWRIGMLAGAAEYLQTVLRFKSNMDSGKFLGLQLAAVEALQLGPEWYQQLNTTYRQRREIARQIMQRLDCDFRQDQVGLFIWAKVPQGKTGYELSDELLYDKQLFITPGGIFGNQGENYLRISLCSNQEQLLAALGRIEP
ncbi:MAG: aminotransferase class I/II-fold pyridoxal phosphate-dependent enzyme [Bacteroidota bacterium]